MSDAKCYVCGDCWWVDCENPADYRHDVGLKSSGKPLYSGEIELCSGHTTQMVYQRGRLNLKPEAIEQAKQLQRTKARA